MTKDQKRALGAFYTPENVTDVLSQWAIRSKSDQVLEPSFGGCNFLTSSIKAFTALGACQPSKSIFGFDVDVNAFDILRQKNISGSNFYQEDFLKYSKTNSEILTASVVLGNPPFLPIHKLSKVYRREIFEKFSRNNFLIPRRASIWAYFIVHSLDFLRAGGRMAWIVPDSIYFTDYGRKILDQLAERFKYVGLFRVDERYFASSGTKEKTSILICDNYLGGKAKVDQRSFSSILDALNEVQNFDRTSSVRRRRREVSPRVRAKYFTLVKLGELFDIRIGIVIGATKYLTFSKDQIKKSEIGDEYFYPIVSKGSQLEGLSISRNKLSELENTPNYLLNAIKLEADNQLAFNNLITSIPTSVLLNSTFRKRSKLFGYDDYRHPDAFLTFFSQGLPKLVINTNQELNSTNSVHRLYLKKREFPSYFLTFVALQFFSDYFSKSATRLARQYGDNILKFEPSDAAKIPVLIPKSWNRHMITSLNTIVKEIDIMINKQEVEKAKLVAHRFIQKILSKSI